MSRYPVNEIVNLPDPLEFSDHTRVRTAEEWHYRRRPEILRLFREQFLQRRHQKFTERFTSADDIFIEP